MIPLQAGDSHLHIDPEQGGCITSAVIDGMEILRPRPIDGDCAQSALYPCVPYFGRVKRTSWPGTDQASDQVNDEWPLGLTHPNTDPQSAIHGEGWINPWSVGGQSKTDLTCRIERKASPAFGSFPYPWSADMTFSINRTGFTVSLCVHNEGSTTSPLGAGLHPFFLCSDKASLHINAQKIFTPPGLGIGPVACEIFTQSKPLDEISLDHSIENWDGYAQLRCPNLGRRITLTSNAPILHIYHPPGAGFICLEPVSHLPGAFDCDPFPASIMRHPQDSVHIEMAVRLE